MGIEFSYALYINLGYRSAFQERSIERDNNLRILFAEADDALCRQGRWEEVTAQFVTEGATAGSASNFTRQVREFYQADEHVIWTTFYNGRLWWGKSTREVTRLDDGSKVRPMIGKWSDRNLKGRLLGESRLSGKLTKTRGFRGTICSVREADYLRRIINGDRERDAVEVRAARQELAIKLQNIIQRLHWRDFELLVDAILQRAGWTRVSEIGQTQNTIDLELLAPITGLQYGVQVKSQATVAEFRRYEQKVGRRKTGRFFFVVHSPGPGLTSSAASGKVKFLGPAEVADWAVKYGLVDWIINKAG